MKESNFETIGKRIKELRIEKKMSQADLGILLSVSQDTVSLWENSKSLPPADIIIKLVEIFGVSADYLLGISEEY
ncbi:MAG: helix-turn-helix domain-containing protein [Clostridiales bacterium]|nr:helix-turn-helix domain-containing protein [Clostridiales bacterium]